MFVLLTCILIANFIISADGRLLENKTMALIDGLPTNGTVAPDIVVPPMVQSEELLDTVEKMEKFGQNLLGQPEETWEDLSACELCRFNTLRAVDLRRNIDMLSLVSNKQRRAVLDWKPGSPVTGIDPYLFWNVDFTFFKPSVFQQFTEMVLQSPTHFSSLCSQIFMGNTPLWIRKYQLKIIPQCLRTIVGKYVTYLGHGDQAMLYDVLDYHFPHNWTLDFVALVPALTTVKDLEKIDPTVFSDLGILREISKRPWDRELIGMLANKVSGGSFYAMADPQGWTPEVLEKMLLGFHKELIVAEMSNIPKSVILNLVQSQTLDYNEVLGNDQLMAVFERAFIDHLETNGSSFQSLNDSFAGMMMPFITRYPNIFTAISSADISKHLMKFDHSALPVSDLQGVLKKLGDSLPSIAYKNSSDGYPSLCRGVTYQQLESMNPSDVYHYLLPCLNHQKDFHLEKRMAMEIKKKIEPFLSANMTVEDIKRLGYALSGLSVKDWDTVPAAVVQQTLATICEARLDEMSSMIIAKKLWREVGPILITNVWSKCSDTFRGIPRRWIVVYNLALPSYGGKTSNVTGPWPQTPITDDDIHDEMVVDDPMPFAEPELSTIDSLMHRNNFYHMLDFVAQREDYIPETKIYAVARALYNEAGNGSAIELIDKDTWRAVGRFAQFLRWPQDMEGLLRSKDSATLLLVIMDEIDQSQLNKLTLQQIQNLYTSSGGRAKRGLLCGRPFGFHSSMELLWRVKSLNQQCCPFPLDMRKQYGQAVKSELNDALFQDAINLMALGSFVIGLEPETLVRIKQDTMSSAFLSIVKDLEHMMQCQHTRTEMGVPISHQEWQQIQTAVKVFLEKAYEVIYGINQTNNVQLTCAGIRLVQLDVTSLSTKHLDTLTPEEFTKCINILGSGRGWSDAQLSSLVRKAKEVMGPVSGWSADNITFIGSITVGLSDKEFSTLRIDNLDTLFSLGRHDGYTQNQLSHGFNNWLNSKGKRSSKDITSLELIALGNFICGMSKTQLEEVHPEEILDGIPAFRHLQCENDDLMEVAAYKVKDVYGSSVTYWNASLIADIGAVTGGLSSNDIKYLTRDQIGEISPNMLKFIPPQKLRAIHPDTLDKFSLNQIRNFPDDYFTFWKRNRKDYLEKSLKPQMTEKEKLETYFNKQHNITDTKGGGFADIKLEDLKKDPMTKNRHLLNSDKRIRNYRKTLKGDELALFDDFLQDQRLRLSPFSLDEMNNMLMQLGSHRKTVMGWVQTLSKDSIQEMLNSVPGDQLDTILLIFKPNELYQIVQGATQEQVKDFCDRMAHGEIQQRYMEYIMPMFPDCALHLATMPRHQVNMGSGEAIVAMNSIRKVIPYDMWTLDFLTLAPHAVKKRDIDNMPRDALLDTAKLKEIIKMFEKDVHDYAMKKMKKEMGIDSPESWGKETLKMMLKDFSKEVKVKDLRKIPEDVVMETLNDLSEDVMHDEKLSVSIQKKVVRYIKKNDISVKDLPAEQVKGMIPFLVKNPKQFKELTADQIRNNLGTINHQHLGKKSARRIIEKLGDSLPPIEELGDLVEALPAKKIDALPAADVMKELPKMKNLKFNKKQMKALRKKVEGTLMINNLTKEKLEDVKVLIPTMTVTELENIPDSVVADSVDTICNADLSTHKRRIMAKKLKNAGVPMSDMGKCVTPETLPRNWLETVNISSLHIDDGMNISVTPAQSSVLFKKVLEEYGEINAANDKFSSANLKKWGEMAVKGPTVKNFKSFMKSNDRLSIVGTLFEQEDVMSDIKAVTLANELRTELGLDQESDLDSLMEDNLKLIARTMQFFKWPKDLSHFHEDDMQYIDTIMEGIGVSELNKVTAEQTRTIAQYSLSKTKRGNSTIGVTFEDTRDAVLTEDDLTAVPGRLICGLKSEQVYRMSNETLLSIMDDIEKCCQMNYTDRKVIVNTLTQNDQYLFQDAEYLQAFGSLLLEIDSTQQSVIDKDELLVALPMVMDKISQRVECQAKRTKMGVGLTKSEHAEEEGDLKNFAGFVVDVLTSAVSRKKRSAVTLTCADIETVSVVLTAIGEDVLAALSDEDFSECMEVLGNESNWHEAQLQALVTKAKSALGVNVYNWSSDDVLLMGSMIAGLTAEEIATLQLNSNDVMSSIGKHTLFTKPQLTAGFQQWLTLVKSGQVSTIDGEDLVALKNFVCGINASEITQISDDNIVNTLSAFQEKNQLDVTQTGAILDKVKNVYGSNVGSWHPSLIADLGVVLGGLNQDEIANLTEDHIGEITPLTVSSVPPTTFKAFTVTQLKLFSPNQKLSITPSQYELLSSDQKKSLDDETSGGVAAYGHCFLMTMVVFAMTNTMFFQI